MQLSTVYKCVRAIAETKAMIGLDPFGGGTLAGQIVMEGFINLRITPWARRLITRGLAIIPAIFVILLYGSGGVGELLILSQVVLSFQLPFAIVPLVSSRAAACCALIASPTTPRSAGGAPARAEPACGAPSISQVTPPSPRSSRRARPTSRRRRMRWRGSRDRVDYGSSQI